MSANAFKGLWFLVLKFLVLKFLVLKFLVLKFLKFLVIKGHQDQRVGIFRIRRDSAGFGGDLFSVIFWEWKFGPPK